MISTVKSILNWLRGHKKRSFKAAETDLKGAPVHARTKTYSSETGYVYQYVYRGYRGLPGLSGTQFVFEATRDRAAKFTIAVSLLQSNLAECEQRIGRELASTERYALAKMTLFSAFDTITALGPHSRPLVPEAAQMEEQLRVLGR